VSPTLSRALGLCNRKTRLACAGFRPHLGVNFRITPEKVISSLSAVVI